MYKQLAYDTYYSWIIRKPKGEIKGNLPNKYKFPDDLEWRTQNKKKVAIMYANFAYVCGKISETYENDSERCKYFTNLAIIYVKKAIKNDEECINAYCTYGTLLSNCIFMSDSYA